MSASLIAIDWGTTNARAALLDDSGDVLETRAAKSGVGQLSAAEFGVRFNQLVDGWPVAPALCAGMVGSRQGWFEADYVECPARIDTLADGVLRFAHEARRIGIVPGLACRSAARCDVMRGEETQVAGLLAQAGGHDSGTIVMPGTHSKWLKVNDGTVAEFTTYMTGDLFGAVGQHTILSHSMAVADGEPDDTLFAAAVAELAASGQSPLSMLFSIRARELLGSAFANGREALSAALILGELQAARHDGYDFASMSVVGSRALTGRYQCALQALGATPVLHDGEQLAWRALYEIAGRSGLLGEEAFHADRLQRGEHGDLIRMESK